MPNQKFSAAPSAAPLQAGDYFPVLRGAATDLHATAQHIKDFVASNSYPAIPTGEAPHYSPAQALAATNFAVVAGTYYAVPFRAKPGDTINGILIEIVAAPTVGGNVSVGLYANDPLTRSPLATAGLIYDSGPIAFDTTSFAISTTPTKIAFPAAQVVPTSGELWVVLQSDTAASMTWRRAGPANVGHNVLPRARNAGAMSTANADTGLTVTGSFGAMPSNPPALVPNATIPIIALYRT